MRITGLAVALALSAVVVLGAQSMHHNEARATMKVQPEYLNTITCATEKTQSGDSLSKSSETIASRVVSSPTNDCPSYIQVLNSVEEDPEHAQARMVTPSYAIH